jgi:hypothetical protein
MIFDFWIPWIGEAPEFLIGDPLQPPGGGTGDFSSLGAALTSLMDYIFAIAGLILLFMIISSGYSLLTSAGNPEAIQKGKSRLTAALVGFLLVFAAFWILQIIEVFLGLKGTFTG